MQQNSLTERITRSLAYMLRHQPEEFDLELDDHGFAEVDDVVCALNERLGEPVREEDVVEALAAGDRPRYEIQAGRIRALYGHSIAIDPGEPSEPPELLYIGLSAIDAGRAAKNGLQGGRRTFLHLAKTREDAEETARRLGGDWAVITVHARSAFEDGVNFYDRQALFLSEFIPTDFLDVGEVQRGVELPGRAGPGFRREGGERGGEHRGERGRGRDSRYGRERSEDERRGELVPRRPAQAPADPPRTAPEPREHREHHEHREHREHREYREPRENREQREHRAADPKPPVAPPQRSPQPSSPAAAASSSSFGLGIYELSPEPPAPARERRVEPEPPAAAQPAPQPAQSESDSGSGFGAGIA